MEFTEEYRDLFEVNENIKFREEPYCLAHCISADFGMFGGIVLEFNRRWDMKNLLLQRYGDQQKNFKACGAGVFPVEVHHQGENTVVYNLVTKQKVSQQPTYSDLRKALELMRDHMVAVGNHRLAIPTIGCGIDGLDWNQVRAIIMEVFKDTNIEILVCRR